MSRTLSRAVRMTTGRHEPGRAELLEHLEPVLAGQADVEHDEVVVAGADEPERALAVAGDPRREAVGPEALLEERGDPGLVLDDQDAAHDATRGSSSVNVAPRPSPSLCANTRPPCARAIERTM